MKTQGERLREERERLGFNQTDFAAIGGLKKLAQINYEQDKRAPDSAYLAAIAAAGADVQYIITGQRSVERLPSREAALLDNYRHSDEKGRKIIEQTAFATAEPPGEYEVKKRGG
ncbi:MAG: transcriptional regulator [Candidatus Competibacter sp.]|nr:transcriptional regulator [Candidatus Competibacter sp.]MDG4583364.1 transcriptional regulator [Candidatus Competibacter sp.]